MLSPTKQPSPVPSIELARLAAAISFPAARRRIVVSAQSMGFPSTVISFLRRFPKGEQFDCAADFMARCEEIELLQHEEQESPEEFLRSP